jgi:hypothetical protein
MIKYSSNFEIIKHYNKECIRGFDATLVEDERFESPVIYNTKNEAIDDMIKKLESLRD